MAKVIAIANQKGGVGKTTTALAIADCLIKKGKRVLFVDTDPQRNASAIYRAKIDDTATLYDLFFSKDIDPKDCIQTTEYGDIISSDELLRNADNEIPANDIGRFKKLKKALKTVEKKYDYVIIDCPPGINILLANVLMASNYVIVPVICDFFSTQGLVDFCKTVEEYKEENEKLKILGFLKVKYKGRQNLSQVVDDGILPDIAKEHKTKVFETSIRESVKAQEAQMMRQALFTYAKNCTTAIDYEEFVEKEILSI